MEKSLLLQYCIDLLEIKIKDLTNLIEDAQESVNSESKSSAGDKHETGREMARQEVDKLGARLMLAQENLQLALKVSAEPLDKAGIGALITTNNGIFYILTSIGKVNYQENDVFVISLNSPLAKMFTTKSVGDAFTFLEKKYVIEMVD